MELLTGLLGACALLLLAVGIVLAIDEWVLRAEDPEARWADAEEGYGGRRVAGAHLNRDGRPPTTKQEGW